MVAEVRNKLLEEAKLFVTKSACRKLYNWLKVHIIIPSSSILVVAIINHHY